MSQDKKKLFLSFTEKDKHLADLIYKLLTDVFDFTVFYSRESLTEVRKGSPGWNKRIKEAILECDCFISLLTKNSLARPWISYEAGIADAYDKDILRIKTASISNDSIAKLMPEQKRNINYEIATENGLKKFIKNIYNVCEIQLPSKNFVKLHLSPQSAKKIVKKITGLSRNRNIFVGGSYYVGKDHIKRARLKGSHLEKEEVLIEVTKQITYELLDNGFTIWCYPFVSEVGKSVALAVYEWCQKKRKKPFNYLRITGGEGKRWKDDSKSFREYTKTGKTFEGLLDAIFKAERKQIIEEMEWVLILGGNRKAKFEAELALESKEVKLCSIPTFDGVGLEYWELESSRRHQPIDKKEEEWSDDSTKRLLRHLNNLPPE